MEWSSIESVLFELGKSVFIAYFLLFLLAVLTERKVSSLVISLMVLSVANGAMTALTPMLYQWSALPGLTYKFVWYGVFASLDGIAIYLLFKFHKLLKQNVSLIATVIGGFFLVLALFQSIRFTDRFIFGTDLALNLYKYGVPILNVVLVPIIIVLWIASIRNSKPEVKAVYG